MSYEGNFNIRTLLVPDATLFYQSITADTDILATDINIKTAVKSKQTRVVGVLTVEVCFAAAGRFSVVRKYGGDTVLGEIKSSTNLAANEIFTMTLLAPEDWDMNFQYSTSTDMKWMIVTLHGGLY